MCKAGPGQTSLAVPPSAPLLREARSELMALSGKSTMVRTELAAGIPSVLQAAFPLLLCRAPKSWAGETPQFLVMLFVSTHFQLCLSGPV